MNCFRCCVIEICSQKHFLERHGEASEGPEGAEHRHPEEPFSQDCFMRYFARHEFH